jgi:DNA-binding response OmpR family regulator
MSHKLAIIEDDPAISQMYRMKFESEGYKVETAENGKIGLDMIEKMKPDMVLLDLMMPEMNGDEMLEIMRATEWGKDIPVIVLTNMGEQEIPAKIEKLGINAFVLKAEMTPKQVEELVKKEISK